MTWIKTVAFEDAGPRLRKIYERIRSPEGKIDNILTAHSLRPASLQGHMTLYKNVLHHSECRLPKWFREAIGTYVSMLNACAYCVEHHYAGMASLIGDLARAETIRAAFEADEPKHAFDQKDSALFAYARVLTLTPAEVQKNMIEALRAEGWDDGIILETNQIVAYFCYANRTVLGLGVNTQGDVLGLSPNDSDDPDNWQHQQA